MFGGLGIKDWIIVGLTVALLAAGGFAKYQAVEIDSLESKVALLSSQRDTAIAANKTLVAAAVVQNASIDALRAAGVASEAALTKALADLATTKKTLAVKAAQDIAEQFKPLAGESQCQSMDRLLGDWWARYRSVQ